MRLIDALNVFELQAGANQDEIKAQYKLLSKKYHPDLNPAGLDMMKLVNAAYDVLKAYDGGNVDKGDQSQANYGAELWNAITLAHSLGLDVEITGAWIWLHGDTKPVKDQIKKAGFFWSPKKKLWYFRPKAYKSRSRGSFTMDDIRSTYGSTYAKKQERDKLKA